MSKAAAGRSTPALSVASPDRRAVLTGASTIAAGALALGTGVAATAIALRPARGQESAVDAELIAIGARLDVAIAAEQTTYPRYCRLIEIAEDLYPDLPKVVPLDVLMFSKRLDGRGHKLTAGLYWSPACVAALGEEDFLVRHALPKEGKPAGNWTYDLADVPEASKRANELRQLIDAYAKTRAQIDAETGAAEAHDAWKFQNDLIIDLIGEIRARPATTLAGAMIKARAAAWSFGMFDADYEDDTFEEERVSVALAEQVVRSIFSLSAKIA